MRREVKASTAGNAADGVPSSDAAQQEPEAVIEKSAAIEPTGPIAVGQKAPNFRLKDQHGQEQARQVLLTDGNVALVFYRSADW